MDDAALHRKLRENVRENVLMYCASFAKILQHFGYSKGFMNSGILTNRRRQQLSMQLQDVDAVQHHSRVVHDLTWPPRLHSTQRKVQGLQV
jgi:hypothetical protein